MKPTNLPDEVLYDLYSMHKAFLIFAQFLLRKPKRATGFYVTSGNVTWGFRTNAEKFPENFIFLGRDS